MIRALGVVLSVALAHPAWGDAAPRVCGDSVVDAGEQCDDGPAGSLTCTPFCTVSVCGDGYVSFMAGEQCDGGSSCDSSCQLIVSTCGDGIVDVGEDCDDGNHTTGDGCSATCYVEAGYSCVDAVGVPIACMTICGDGIIAGGETCDVGNRSDQDGCSATCDIEAGWTCSGTTCTATCGDGIQVAGEPCDDGNSQTGDGCTPACTVEPGWTCRNGSCETTCGDGIVAGAEQCDDGNRRAGDGCSATCTLDTMCASAACTGMMESGPDAMVVEPNAEPNAEPTGLARTAGCNTTGTDGSVLLVLGALFAVRRRKRC